MTWHYCFAHVWDSPSTVWEDVYLRPAESLDAQSIWLTVDALGDPTEPSHGSDRAEFISKALTKLGTRDFWVDDTQMIVRAREFTQPELVDWVKIWIQEMGLPVGDLIAVQRQDFDGSNEHASIINSLMSESSAEDAKS